MHKQAMIRRTLLALALGTSAAGGVGAQPGTESVGRHGMLVVGRETVYISHLPMFMAQHRYQGLWEVSFGQPADAAYRAERARPENAGAIFTLVPKDLFRLPELTTARKSFRADVFRGHFEREGHERILADVTVTLKQQVHWHPFRNRHQRPEALTGILFGRGGELFLAHWISVAPSYDQIVSVTPSVPLGDLPVGAQIVLPKRADGQVLRAGEAVSGMMVVDQGPEQPARLQPIDLKVVSEIYLEKGELEDNDLEDRT